jgi:hypothetical protein
VPDILNLEFRVSVDGKTHKGPFVMGQGTSVPIVLPFGPSKPVSKSKRDLVQNHLPFRYIHRRRASALPVH